MIFGADTDIWRYQPHPEVWLLIIGAAALAWYAVKVIGPKVVPAGQPIVTRRQSVAYVVAVLILWIASDWPMHDISEEYLYSVHMVQHMLFSLVVPPLLLIATPEWLARLVVSGDGTTGRWIRRLANPVVAGILFNIVAASTHAPVVVQASLDYGWFHYLVHTVVFAVSILMWTPVIGPLPELRISLPAQMVYLFLMSVIPTIPAAWLTFATDPVYASYDHPVRVWGVSVADDQQAAGLIMKLVGGLYLWAWITARFFLWSQRHYDQVEADLEAKRVVRLQGELTVADVEAEFAKAGPPKPESPAS